jgi:hypothetical protein
MTAMVLSLAYVLFGAWDSGWSPEPLWAQILFFPGVTAGQICWTSFSYSNHLELFCRFVGIGTMGLVGGIIGWVLHVLIRRRQYRKPRNEKGSA